MATQADKLLARLIRREARSNTELLDRLKRGQKAVGQKIQAAAEKQRIASSAATRTKTYNEVAGIYEETAAGIDAMLEAEVSTTAREWHDQAKSDIKRIAKTAGSFARFDPRLVRDYMQLVQGDSVKGLAGALTQSMTATDIRALRGAFVDTFRQQSIEGWTAREVQKNLQTKWDALAKNLVGDRFIDSAGRRWDNSTYLNMLTTTTLNRVQRESYADSVAAEGFNLVRIIDDGEPCATCNAWTGLILDMGGTSAKSKFPSLSDAYAGGWGHPNCGCRLEVVIPEVDGKDIALQENQKPVDWNDQDAVQDYNDQTVMAGKRADGMDDKEALRSLKRDKIKRELQFADRNFDHAVDDIPDATIDGMDKSKIPRIETAKKGVKPNSTRDSSLGGVIHLDKDATGEDFDQAFTDLQVKRGQQIATPKAPTPEAAAKKIADLEAQIAVLDASTKKIDKGLAAEDRKADKTTAKAIVRVEAQGKEFIKDSYYDKPLYHGTPKPNVGSVSKEGLSVGEGANTGVALLGKGVYVTPDRFTASVFAQAETDSGRLVNGDVFKVYANVKNPLVLKNKAQLKRVTAEAKKANKGLANYLQGQGYDAVDASAFDKLTGINIFSPRNIRTLVKNPKP